MQVPRALIAMAYAPAFRILRCYLYESKESGCWCFHSLHLGLSARACALAGRLTGTLLGVKSIPSLPLSAEGQAHRLIVEATDKENLGSMYIWCACCPRFCVATMH